MPGSAGSLRTLVECAPQDEVLAFAAYLAALDNEERASLLYEKLVQRVGEHVGS